MNRKIGAALVGLLLLARMQEAFAQPAALTYGNDAVSSPDSVSLPQATERWFTQGNGTSVAGTQVPAYWVNKVGGEISSAIQSGPCSQTLSMTNRSQLQSCIANLFLSHAGQSFTSTTTWTAPANVYHVKVRLWAAGGGATASNTTSPTGSGIGGGGGGYVEGYANVTPGSPYSVVVGSGGTGGSSSNTNGGTGGISSFGGMTASPGTGAAFNSAAGNGGFGSGGIMTIPGGPGAFGTGPVNNYVGGAGGSSFGSVPYQVSSSGTLQNGFNGGFPGGGGSGGVDGGTGGAGANGLVVLEY